MTTQRQLQRRMKAVARVLRNFDLVAHEGYQTWGHQPGNYPVYLPHGFESLPERQGMPTQETINEMVRLGNLAPKDGRFYLTPLGESRLLT